MHLTQVVSNRVEFDYNDEKGGEYVEISLISDDKKEMLCRVNQDGIVDAQNFWNLTLQFAQVAAQRKLQGQKVLPVQGQLVAKS